jgi:hypothetical protein
MRQVIEDSDPTILAPEQLEAPKRLTIAQQKSVAARETIQGISAEAVVCMMNERLRFHAERRGYKV